MPLELGSFDITFSSVAASLIFSAVGWWLFREGKKRNHLQVVFIGMALMIYSYFTHGPLQDWGFGAALCGLAYYIW
jgi:Na+/phosphate symporter